MRSWLAVRDRAQAAEKVRGRSTAAWFGNLKRAIEALAAMVADGFARDDVAA
jgi:hypothetical protein